MANENQSDRGTARVVLVDDHPIVIAGLSQIINREPQLEVCGSAESPAAAMSVIAQEKPDIVVTDLSFAEGSGLDFIKDVRSRFPGLPVLVLSVRDESLYAERTLRAGARGYVMKDEAGDKVREAILCVLDGDIYLSGPMAKEMLQKIAISPDKATRTAAELLSDRELQVFELAGEGMGTNAIAAKLFLSPKTIETYQAKIKEKLSFRDAAELRRHAIQWVQSQGLI